MSPPKSFKQQVAIESITRNSKVMYLWNESQVSKASRVGSHAPQDRSSKAEKVNVYTSADTLSNYTKIVRNFNLDKS
jgi:hypothetical protein